MHEVPKSWSVEACDFVNKLIRRKPSHRLGFNNGVSELKLHPWLASFPWKELESGNMKAPWVPNVGDNFNNKQMEFNDDLQV
jgi:hypothetical protein